MNSTNMENFIEIKRIVEQEDLNCFNRNKKFDLKNIITQFYDFKRRIYRVGKSKYNFEVPQKYYYSRKRITCSSLNQNQFDTFLKFLILYSKEANYLQLWRCQLTSQLFENIALREMKFAKILLASCSVKQPIDQIIRKLNLEQLRELVLCTMLTDQHAIKMLMKVPAPYLRVLIISNFQFTTDGIKILKKKIGPYVQFSLKNQYNCNTSYLMRCMMDLLGLQRQRQNSPYKAIDFTIQPEYSEGQCFSLCFLSKLNLSKASNVNIRKDDKIIGIKQYPISEQLFGSPKVLDILKNKIELLFFK